MDTARFSIAIEPYQGQAPWWTHEGAARLIATETYAAYNGHKRLVPRSVILSRDGAIIDRLDDAGWLSQRLV